MSVNLSGLVQITAIAISCVPIFGFNSASAQGKQPRYTEDAIYAEGFGQGLLYSVNYDHRFAADLSVRIGVTSWSLGSRSDMIGFTGFPFTVNYLLGSVGQYLELGIGVVPVTASASLDLLGARAEGSASAVVGTATVGYRYQPVAEGMLFRIGFTPWFTFKGVKPWGGISLGYAF